MFVTTAFAASEGETHNAAAGETHTETGVPHGDGHSAMFPPFDSATFPSQILWLAITFGLFYLFLKNAVVPRIAGILEVRHDRIAQDLDQAARMKQEADEAIAAYEQELADARAKANQIGQEARDAAKAEADAERKETEAALDKKLADAESRIAAIKADAMKDVGAIAEETAMTLVEQLVGKATKTEIAAAVKSVNG
ncbi:ATP F0F1 synthase subunit B' [Zhengella mangrovi]|uniref:ATP synthase subunit b n=1 Tax=Zhengella mangrovi TaxID=1982044 RepID=A0A2G1QNN5_9HYPH|nr:F0F1 ATP synthase subunit B [Zhengella mangrovi]PHP67070.1 ATP F0F1 synthase subunit B' [Zhengella mangrovi]